MFPVLVKGQAESILSTRRTGGFMEVDFQTIRNVRTNENVANFPLRAYAMNEVIAEA